MNHLIVSLNNNLEILGSSSNNIGARIIEKLYDLARTGLDNSSTLLGNLLVDKAYGDAVDWLNANTGLNITVPNGNRYIRFADPEVQRVLKDAIGDGVGVTESVPPTITNALHGPYFSHFQDNADIVSFNEFSLFTSLTTLYQAGPYYYSPSGIFKNCTSLVSIDLSNVAVVAEGTFDGCTSLKNLGNFHPMHLCVDSRGIMTFRGCSSLEEIDLSNVDLIPAHCFSTCSSLNNIGSLDNVVWIGAMGFNNCLLLDFDVNLPNYNNTGDPNGRIERGSFRGTRIRSISNLGKARKIDGTAYSEATWDNGAFAHCTNLRSAILPATVEAIGQAAFAGDTALEYIKLLSVTPPTIDSSADWHSFKGTTCKFYVPNGTLSAYQAASGWDALCQAGRVFEMSQFSTDFPNG